MSGQPAEQRTVVKPTASKYVKLNVGGALFNTTIGTLTKQDSMLRAMFSGRMEVLTDSEGEFNQLVVLFSSSCYDFSSNLRVEISPSVFVGWCYRRSTRTESKVTLSMS